MARTVTDDKKLIHSGGRGKAEFKYAKGKTVKTPIVPLIKYSNNENPSRMQHTAKRDGNNGSDTNRQKHALFSILRLLCLFYFFYCANDMIKGMRGS